MNPQDNLGIWLAILTVATTLAAWNITRLTSVRRELDRLVALLGAGAILAVVIGASLVVTEVTECTFAASSLACSRFEILIVALTDLAVSAALITLWLRSDACRAPRVVPRTRRHRAVSI
jgi:hypothetical protein